MKKAVVYYTDNYRDDEFYEIIRDHLKNACGDIPIIWVSQKPIPEKPNVVLSGIGRNRDKSMWLQILAGVRKADADIIFFAENDVIYHSSHFDFIPKEKDVFYYNLNRWWLRSRDGQASFKRVPGALSQLVAYKGIIEDFYVRRLALKVQGVKVKCGTEPGKQNVPEMPQYKIGYFYSKVPSIDIRHEHNLSRSNRFKSGYILQDRIPGWGKTKGRYKEFLKCLTG